MSSISPQQLWIVNFQLWILWLPFELLPRILDVPRTYLPRSFDVSWMYLESIFCLATIFLPSCYLLPTHYFVFTKRIFHIIIVLWKNSAFINSELPIAHWIDLTFQFSIFNFQLIIVNCQFWIVNSYYIMCKYRFLKNI